MSEISEQELDNLIAERRTLTGESYSAARKAVLEHLKTSGRISESEYMRLKNAGGR